MFTSLDGFGEPITVNYKGKSTYQTVPGAILSLISFMIVISYGAVQLADMVGMNNPSINVFDNNMDADDMREFKFDENRMEMFFTTQVLKKPYSFNLNEWPNPK